MELSTFVLLYSHCQNLTLNLIFNVFTFLNMTPYPFTITPCAREMVREIKMLATKPDDLSSTPGKNPHGGRKEAAPASRHLALSCAYAHACTHRHIT